MDVTLCPENTIIVDWQNRSLYFSKKTGQLGQVQFRVLQSRNDWFRYCCAIAIIQDFNTRDCQTNAWLGVGDELAGEILNRFRWKLRLGVRTSYWKHHFPRGEEANYKYTKTWIVDDVGAKTYARATEVFYTLSDRYILGEPEEEPNGLHRFWSVEFVNTDEEFSQFKQAVLELPGVASHAEDSSSLVDEVIHYLRNLADECARLPSYFPAHLHFDGSEETPFDELRQTVQLVTDRHRLDEWLAEQREQMIRQGLDPDSMAYGPRRGLPEQKGEYEGTPEIEILDWDERASRRFKRAVILGDPGFGKTWLLRYEARRLALESIRELEDDESIEAIRLPIFCRLSDLAPFDRPLQDGILEFLRHEHGHQENKETLWRFVGEKLLTDQCVLLLDAWDEVPEKLRLQKRIEAFARRFGQPGILLTSRIVGYEPKLAPLPNAKELEIAAFDWPKIRAFVQVWFGRQRKLAKTFLTELEKNRQMRGLARIPLMLSLMCRICPEGTFPQRRSGLYEACLKGLIRDWVFYDRKSGVRDIELDAASVEVLLEHLATLSLELLQQRCEQFSSLQLVEILGRWYGDEKALDLIRLFRRRGILVAANSSDDPALLFLHRMFQEYLAARALAAESNAIESALEYLYDPEWHEVLVLLGGLLGARTSGFIAALLRENKNDLLCRPLLLALDVATEVGKDGLPESFLRGMAEVIGNMYFDVKCPVELPPARVVPLLGDYLQETCINRTRDIWGRVRLKSEQSSTLLVPLLFGDRSADTCMGEALDMHAEMRRRAIAVLGEIGSPSAIDALLRTATDLDEGIRHEVAAALARIRSLEFEPALLTQLSDADVQIRRLVLKVLSIRGSREAIPVLSKLLRDDKQDPCGVDAEALRKVGCSNEDMPMMLDWLRQAVLEERADAAFALGNTGSPEAICALADSLKDENAKIRSAAAGALGSVARPEVIPALLVALDDDDQFVRSQAATALGVVGLPDAIPALIGALEDDHHGVRSAAAEALGRIGHHDAVPLLVMALSDEDSATRGEAAKALGRIGSPEAGSALIEAFRDENELVCCHAAEALGSMSSPELVPRLSAGLEEPGTSMYAAIALGASGYPKALGALAKTLSRGSWRTRASAARAMGVIGVPETVSPLLAALEDEDLQVRAAAAEALGRVGSPKAIRFLTKVLGCHYDPLHRNAMAALKHISKRPVAVSPWTGCAWFRPGRRCLKSLARVLESPAM